MDHAMKECEVANFYGQASDADAYVCNGARQSIFMENTFKPVSYYFLMSSS